MTLHYYSSPQGFTHPDSLELELTTPAAVRILAATVTVLSYAALDCGVQLSITEIASGNILFIASSTLTAFPTGADGIAMWGIGLERFESLAAPFAFVHLPLPSLTFTIPIRIKTTILVGGAGTALTLLKVWRQHPK
jgi:hypothetical protein